MELNWNPRRRAGKAEQESCWPLCNVCVCLEVSKSGLFFLILSVCVCVYICGHVGISTHVPGVWVFVCAWMRKPRETRARSLATFPQVMPAVA